MIFIGTTGIYGDTVYFGRNRRRAHKYIAKDIYQNIETILIHNSSGVIKLIGGVYNYSKDSLSINFAKKRNDGKIAFLKKFNEKDFKLLANVRDEIKKQFGDDSIILVNKSELFNGFIQKEAVEKTYDEKYQRMLMKKFKTFTMKSRYLDNNPVM